MTRSCRGQSLADQVPHGSAGLEHRIQRDPGLGPLVAAAELVVDVLLNARVVDVDERGRERAVVVDQLVTNAEYVHLSPRVSTFAEH